MSGCIRSGSANRANDAKAATYSASDLTIVERDMDGPRQIHLRTWAVRVICLSLALNCRRGKICRTVLGKNCD